MTAIWHDGGDGWHALAPVGFADEASLHDLIERAPQLLPLAGSPQLVVLGREVSLGGNAADLIAVEPSGRLAIIEIKLSRNSEARRAVVAQVLTYAAYLQGQSLDVLERSILSRHLRGSGVSTIAEAVQSDEQGGSFDEAGFVENLEQTLAAGQFRLVIVLDSAPSELVRLVGYLSSISDHLVIDLVTVSAYEVGGSRVMVPQRVEPEPNATHPDRARPATAAIQVASSDGVQAFLESIDQRPEAERAMLRELAAWAQKLENEGLARLQSFRGSTRTTLIPQIRPENVGLVTVATEQRPLWLYRSVFERFAPQLIPKVEEVVGRPLGQGNSTVPSAALLEVLTDAYRTAVAKGTR